MSNIKKILFELSVCGGVSGREESAAEKIVSFVRPFADSVEVDRIGNIMAFKKSSNPKAKTVLLDAHYDEIGMMVTEITKEGFARFTNIGGVDKRILLANEVIIHGRRDVPGIICCKPPHLSTREEEKNTIPPDKLVIDIGMKKETAETVIRVGDSISFRSAPKELLNRAATGKAFDDRAAVAVLIKTMEQFHKEQLPFHLVMLASAQEETVYGVKTAAFYVDPDEVITLDVSHAYTPDAAKDETGVMGKGPMIGYAATLDRELYKRLVKLAEEKKIPYQHEIMSSRSGTNADAIQIVKSGKKIGLISIPLKYMHTTVETLSVEDLENCVKLLAAYLTDKKERAKL